MLLYQICTSTAQHIIMIRDLVSLAALLASLTEAKYFLNSELVLQDPKSVGEVVKSKRPHEYLKAETIPAEWDLRKQGMLTTDLNQHIPVYCGSCKLYFKVMIHE